MFRRQVIIESWLGSWWNVKVRKHFWSLSKRLNFDKKPDSARQCMSQERFKPWFESAVEGAFPSWGTNEWKWACANGGNVLFQGLMDCSDSMMLSVESHGAAWHPAKPWVLVFLTLSTAVLVVLRFHQISGHESSHTEAVEEKFVLCGWLRELNACYRSLCSSRAYMCYPPVIGYLMSVVFL